MPTIKLGEIKYTYCKSCLLCSKPVPINSPTSSSLICDECKEVWSKIKETYKDGEEQK